MIEIKDKFKENENVVVGVSGGADSMVLLELLAKKAKDEHFNLYCVHVNHQIRGKEADKDEALVKQFCEKNAIFSRFFHIDCLKLQKIEKRSLEEVARIYRYKCFDEVLKETGSKKLYLAHHKNDQAETVLFNIIRGSGIYGLTGIKSNTIIKRPLLNYTKSEIIEFAKLNNIKFRTDSTNLEESCARNIIRLKVIPELEKINPQAVDAIINLSKLAQEDEDFFESLMPNNLVKLDENKVIFKTEISNFPNPISVRFIRKNLAKLGFATDIGRVHYGDIINLAKLRSGAKISLPNGLVAVKNYDEIIICKGEEVKQNDDQIMLQVGLNKLGGVSVEFEKIKQSEVNFESGDKFADFDKIPNDAIFRHRKLGDKFEKINGGTKKLNDILTDLKVPTKDRDNLWVLARGNQVLWIIGKDIAETIKIDETTENFARFSLK